MNNTALVTLIAALPIAIVAIGWQYAETALMESQVPSVANVCDYAMGKSDHLSFHDTRVCAIRAPYARTKAFQRADRELASGKASLRASF